MQSSVKATSCYLAAAMACTLLSTAALASPILEARCSTDSIDIASSRARVEWARACGDRINVQSPTNPTPPAQAFLIGVTSANGVGLWEYIETDDFWGKRSYSGDTA